MSVAEKLTTIAENTQKIYEAGKKAEYGVFWDTFQQNGTRTNYDYAFASRCWNEMNMKPKYPMAPTTMQRMFQNNDFHGDLTQVLTLDFSKATTLSYVFAYAYFITHIGVADTTSSSSLEGTFYYARSLTTIDKLILKADGSQSFGNAFVQCYALQNLIIEGVIGKSIDFKDSPLSKLSIMSVVEHLSGTAQGQTLTLKSNAKEAAFTDKEWEELAATRPNWTFSFA